MPHTVADVKQWEIWRVVWRHEDGTSKPRPALAVSSQAYNAANGHAVFVKITSQVHSNVPGRLKIDSANPDFRHTGLDVTSWIHGFDDQRVVDADLLDRLGHINAITAVYLAAMLKAIIPKG